MKYAIVTSYCIQIYTALIGILMMPVYLRYLGSEAFGLVAVYTTLQTWLYLLDFGMTPTISRQMACYKAGTLSRHALGELLRTLELLFAVVAMLIVLVVTLSSTWLAVNWLQLAHLQVEDVVHCIEMMAVIYGFRWIAGIYHSGLIGLEYQTLNNGIVAFIATLRFVGAVPLLAYISSRPIAFFSYQVVLAVLEVLFCHYCLYQRLGKVTTGVRPSVSALKDILPFAGSLAFTSLTSIFIMNFDKLLFSHFLPLNEYGYFTLAVTIAAGVVQLISPISQVVQPRMTILFSQDNWPQQILLFREVSQFTSGLMAAVCINVAVFSAQLLLAWTGNSDVAEHCSYILFWYALGNGVMGIHLLPYLVQHATGNLRLHVIGNAISALVQIPAIFYAAVKYGTSGTGAVWFASNLILLLIWVPVIFHRYLKGLYLEWMLKDVVLVWMAASIPAIIFTYVHISTASRVWIVIQLMLIGCLSLFFAWFAGEKMRARLVGLILWKKAKS